MSDFRFSHRVNLSQAFLKDPQIRPKGDRGSEARDRHDPDAPNQVLRDSQTEIKKDSYTRLILPSIWVQ